jgi:hypothetical protein
MQLSARRVSFLIALGSGELIGLDGQTIQLKIPSRRADGTDEGRTR